MRGLVFILVPAAAAILWIAAVERGEADIYSYTDEAGVVHFSNVPSDIRYRFKLKEEEALKVFVNGDRSTRFDPVIEYMSRKNNLDPDLVKAIIKAESDFNPSAVSSSGACGLMQLMPETARDLDVVNVFDPGQNIGGGTQHFRRLLDLFGEDIVLSLAAYNAGEFTVLRYGSVPPYEETENYIEKVLGYYDHYKME